MRRGMLLGLVVVIAGLCGPADASARDVDSTGAVVADTSLVFRVGAGHRLYPDWNEEHEVKLQEEFWLGDLPFRAVIRRFMSDFKIIDGRRVNQSLTLKNPAVFVVVLGDSAAADSSWAFLNFPPHFSPDSFFTFQLEEVLGYTPPAEDGGGN